MIAEIVPLSDHYAEWQRADRNHAAAFMLTDEATARFFLASDSGSRNAAALETAYKEAMDAQIAAGDIARNQISNIIEAEAHGLRDMIVKLRAAVDIVRQEQTGEGPSDDIRDRFIIALLADAVRIAAAQS
jgi:hypothetical protein